MEFRYRYRDQDYVIHIELGKNGAYIARVGERTYAVHVERRDDGEMALMVNGRRIAAQVEADKHGKRYVALLGREAAIFELARAQGAASRGAAHSQPGELTAQMPGQVRQLFVKEGDRVSAGQAILLLEAMKMEIKVNAPADGVLARLLVKTGDTVERGQELAVVSTE